MKQSCEVTAALIFILAAASANTLVAQPYSFDENGNGTSTILAFIPPLVTPLAFEVVPDPTDGITTSPVLIYTLGANVVSGDVEFMEPDGRTVAALLRFFNPLGGFSSEVIFYSQVDGSLAGVGIPSSVNPVYISGVSPNTVWFPGGNQPGAGVVFPVFDLFKYNITIAGIPEPSSASLMLVATGAWLTAWVSRRKGSVRTFYTKMV